MKILITVIVLAAVSYGIATVWQKAEDAILNDKPASSATETDAQSADESDAASEQPEVSDTASSAAESASEVVSSDATTTDAATESSEVFEEIEFSLEDLGTDGATADDAAPAKIGYQREAVAGAVAESKAVGYDYFNDAIFFGDSISTGIPLYMQTMVPKTAVIAAQGVSPGGANTSQCISIGGNRVTMLEAAASKGERSKVYIMLGANALDLDKDSFISGYDQFLKSVKAAYPDAIFYVQSMLPVTSTVNNVYKSANINNNRIVDYNKAIEAMAQQNGAYYIDVAQSMVDANGMLPTAASPLDGMHLTPEYYVRWFDYLRTHTVTK